ncbi:transglutaminaseTgpA domain-containing protein [soil metagenome]
MSSRPPRSRSLLPAAEACLALVTLTAVASFWRLFVDATFFVPLAVIALSAHALALVTRRRGWGLGRAAFASAAALALGTTWVLYAETTTWLVPTGSTLDQMGTDLSDAWARFQDVVAPTDVAPGFVLACGVAVWAAVFIADWAAFRLWVPFEAVVPAGTVFVFASLLGSSKQRGGATMLFVAAVLGFILVHRVARQQTSTSWLASDVARGSNALLAAGAGLVAVTVVVASVVGPLLPGAEADALLAWRDLGDGPDSRQTVSPLVEIRGRLVNQSNIELFTVRSDRRAYWRITALDSFDGTVWSSRGDYGEADGSLPRTLASQAEQAVATQEFTVRRLAAIWLPAAFEARSIQSPEFVVRWEAESSTLIVDNDYEDSDGARYTVQSAVPVFDAAALAGVPAGVPDEIAARYLDLPGDLNQRVRDQALSAVGDRVSPYERALALQEFFRDNFTYELDGTPGGHDGSAMEQFLFETRAGYCEQFAGSYAAMARAVGLPARVAVGFTPGDVDPDDPTLYHVKGLHAHAWPEVYLGGYGWVAFEPTPGRGAPGGESYTGVPEQQADSANPSSATTIDTLPEDVGEAPAETPATTAQIADGLSGGAVPEAEDARPSLLATWWPRLAMVLGALVVMIVVYVIGVPAWRSSRRRLRRKRAVEPVDQVRVAWQESAEAMALLGVAPRPAETPAEFASRARPVIASPAYDDLATTMAAADYSSGGVDEADAGRAWELSSGIAAEARRRATRKQLLTALFDPRRSHRTGAPAKARRRAGPLTRTTDEAGKGEHLELVDR